MQYNIYQIPLQTQYTESLIGKNAKNVLIVLQKSAYQSHADLLQKIMQSVGVDLSEDCLVFPLDDGAYLPFSRLQESHEIKHVVIFGNLMTQIGIQARTPGNAPFHFARAQFLRTYSLPELTGDQNKKRHLWNALKQMFQQA